MHMHIVSLFESCALNYYILYSTSYFYQNISLLCYPLCKHEICPVIGYSNHLSLSGIPETSQFQQTIGYFSLNNRCKVPSL